MPSGMITNIGERALARFLAQNISHAAIGRGNWVDKSNPPGEDYLAEGLTSEIGRIPPSEFAYLIEDVAGTIEFSDDPSTYRLATVQEIADAELRALAPSRHLMVKVLVPANVAVGEAVCEIGLFIGSQTQTAGFAVPAQVTDPGEIAWVGNVPISTLEVDAEFERWIHLLC